MKHVKFHLNRFLRRVRIHGGEFDTSARAMYRDEVVYPLQAELRIVRRSTIERKQMSTKTTFKRIALVTVAALGFGVLSSVAPASAAQADASDTSTVTAITAGTAGAVQVGQRVEVPVTVTGTFPVDTASVLKLAVIPVTAPTGSAIDAGTDFAIQTANSSGVLAADATAAAKTLVNKYYQTGNGALGGADIDAVTSNAMTSIITLNSTHIVATSVKVWVTFTADKAGTYTFTVINDTTVGGALDSGEVSSALITVSTATPVASVAITMIGVETPVVVINLVNALVFGRSRRASIKMQSVIGASINTDTSAGRIFTSCCNRPRAGSRSALPPEALVKIRIFAIRGVRIHS